MLAAYDAYIGHLMKVCLQLYPDLLSGSDRTLTFAQLSEFASVEDARNFVLEREVDATLRKTHTEQLEWFDAKFKIEFLKHTACWPEFVEISERRNLFVHTGGTVSSQYIQNCRRHGVPLPEAIKVGDEIDDDQDYFESAADRIYEIGVTLGHVLWRKLAPHERDDADSHLIELSYDLLTEERYTLAARLLEFASRLKKYASDEGRRILIINRAIVTKVLDGASQAVSILDAEDWSATGEKFRLAEAAIRDDKLQAIAAMRRIGTSGIVEKWSYREWPLLADLRSDSDFIAAFEEIFGEPLNRTAAEQLPSSGTQS
jgi:hypothetical protein